MQISKFIFSRINNNKEDHSRFTVNTTINHIYFYLNLLAQNTWRLFQRHSSQPISWLSTVLRKINLTQ